MTAIHDTHHESVDVTRPGRWPGVLMVVANPTTSSTTGWPVGFWAVPGSPPIQVASAARERRSSAGVSQQLPSLGGRERREELVL